MRRIVIGIVVLALCVLGRLALAGERPGSTFHVHEVKAFVMEKPRRFARKLGEVRFGEEVKVVGEDREAGWLEVEWKKQSGWLPMQALTNGPYALRAGQKRGGATADRGSVQLAARGFSPEVEGEFKKQHPEIDYELVDAVEASLPDPDAVVGFAEAGGVSLGESP